MFVEEAFYREKEGEKKKQVQNKQHKILFLFIFLSQKVGEKRKFSFFI